jgi:hypothetical protein
MTEMRGGLNYCCFVIEHFPDSSRYSLFELSRQANASRRVMAQILGLGSCARRSSGTFVLACARDWA